MKILIVTQIYPGYLEESRQTSPFAVHYFAQEWCRQGHDVEVVRIWPYRPFPFSTFMGTHMKKYAFIEKFNKEGVNVYRLPIKKVPLLDFQNKQIKLSVRQIKKQVSEFDPDVIVSHAISPAFFIGKQLSEELNKPMCLTIHSTDITYLSKQNRLNKYKRNMDGVDGVFFRSRSLRDEYSNIIKEQQKGPIIPSGIDKREILKKEEFINKSTKRTDNFVVACNLIKSKGVDTILEVFKRLKGSIKLTIIGDGPQRKKLEEFVQENELNNIVTFLGVQSREKVLQVMHDSDVFVMVSSPETFGLVYVEAMSKGCIVIGTKGEGIDGIIDHKKNGFLCEFNNVEKLHEIINYCINMSKRDKQAILLNTYETVKNLTIEECANKYLEALENTLIK